MRGLGVVDEEVRPHGDWSAQTGYRGQRVRGDRRPVATPAPSAPGRARVSTWDPAGHSPEPDHPPHTQAHPAGIRAGGTARGKPHVWLDSPVSPVLALIVSLPCVPPPSSSRWPWVPT